MKGSTGAAAPGWAASTASRSGALSGPLPKVSSAFAAFADSERAAPSERCAERCAASANQPGSSSMIGSPGISCPMRPSLSASGVVQIAGSNVASDGSGSGTTNAASGGCTSVGTGVAKAKMGVAGLEIPGTSGRGCGRA